MTWLAQHLLPEYMDLCFSVIGVIDGDLTSCISSATRLQVQHWRAVPELIYSDHTTPTNS